MSTERPTPERIFGLINAYRSSQALKGALDLGLFTALGAESKSAAELADRVGAAERGVRILCDFLTIEGLLEKHDGEYRASADAALFLDEGSPAYVGAVGKFMLESTAFHSFADVAGIVRKGGTLLEGQGTVEPNHPFWIDFARSMVPVMQPSAEFIGELVTREYSADRPLRVLDVAAGHGIFGVHVAKRHPKAEIVALDWPAVLEVASENAKLHGVDERHTTLEGDAFDVEFGNGFDVVLLTNFLHHFDAATCIELLRKARGALNDGGRAVTLEFVPNEDRVSPAEEAAFSMVMLATTASGDAYTFRELQRMAADAGFSRSELHRPETTPQSVVVSTV
ncbi:MAG: methyltransferase domain-containing protein [bacterium]|nr:methyltransferase domain-containing protein [bacterium]